MEAAGGGERLEGDLPVARGTRPAGAIPRLDTVTAVFDGTAQPTSVYDRAALRVITSYSIHYTKLYEDGDEPGTRRGEVPQLLQGAPGAQQSLLHQVLGGVRAVAEPEGVVLQVAAVGLHQCFEQRRITSYNVCYTKLLRTRSSSAAIKMTPGPSTR